MPIMLSSSSDFSGIGIFSFTCSWKTIFLNTCCHLSLCLILSKKHCWLGPCCWIFVPLHGHRLFIGLLCYSFVLDVLECQRVLCLWPSHMCNHNKSPKMDGAQPFWYNKNCLASYSKVGAEQGFCVVCTYKGYSWLWNMDTHCRWWMQGIVKSSTHMVWFPSFMGFWCVGESCCWHWPQWPNHI